MSSGFHLSVIVENQVAFSQALSGTLVLGRQQTGEPEPFQLLSGQEIPRLVIAAANDIGVSRRQLQVQELPNGRVEITNLSASAPLQLMARPALGPGEQTILELPCSVAIGTRLLLNFSQHAEVVAFNELPEATMLPGQGGGQPRLGFPPPALPAGINPEPLIKALQVVMDRFLSAADDAELYTCAVEAALGLIGFDTAHLLRLENGLWQEVISRNTGSVVAVPNPPSRQVLESVRERKRTFWKNRSDSPATMSLASVTGVIGAPVLNAQGEVIGLLYGDRELQGSSSRQKDFQSIDARLMELLACGIASGLARLNSLQRAEEMRTHFAQFFSPELAAELEQNPGLLEGQDAEVSLLFCDIRGFSRISERIGATETFHWIHDVMDVLSDCVLEQDGVLVDYIGDEIMAMWGAPRPQPRHAERACRAALSMLAAIPELNARWEHRLGEPVQLSIGVNSGQVKVGNAGSRKKFKYSPLGTAVNVASRLVGATRHLNSSLLITGTTARQLPAPLSAPLFSRKLCDVQVVNVDETIELFELPTSPMSEQLLQDYEQSRIAFEQREFRAAAHRTARLLEAFPDDGPSLVLLSRAVQALVDGPEPGHPVWKLSEK